MTNANRIIRLQSFQDIEGKDLGGIKSTETNFFSEELKNFAGVSLFHENSINVVANSRLYPSMVGFVNADFWKMYDFDFLYGRPFSKEDCTNRKRAAVITENVSQSYFRTRNGVGEKIAFQGNEYEITGVVRNVSFFSTPTDMCTTWVPYVFDKFIPNGTYTFTLDAFAPPSMSMNEAKENLSKVVLHYFENKNIRADFPPQKIKTLEEASTGSDMFQYGALITLFLFLIIPAVNILSLGNANTNNRAEEIALRRTFGAGCLSSFMLIIMENLLLVLVGSAIGLVLAVPAMNLILHNLIGNSFLENLSLIDSIDYAVIFVGVLPAMLVFTLLSGGLPAWVISRRNIAHVLKGGSK
jgi:ABC-type antimicrobial peptide transport system permease subunit